MYTYSNNIKLDMSAFDQACSDYCYYSEEYETFAKSYKQLKREACAAADYMEDIKIDCEYWRKYAERDRAWDALRLMCQLVRLNPDAVLRVFKAIRRNSQYQHAWDFEAHFSYDRTFEFEDKRPGSIESFCDLCRA